MRQLTTGLNIVCNDVEVLSNVCVSDIVKAKIQSSSSREHIDDSLYLCDLGEVMLKHKTWMDIFPKIGAHYAVRCNQDKMLLKWLIALGVGFNCANKAEIQLLLDLGASADKIVFGNPCKQASHVRFAAKNNIKLVGFDSSTELKKMKKNYPEAQLLLCIAADDSEASDEMNMKYGASMKDAQELISLAVELGLNLVGISFNVGFDNYDDKLYGQAFERARSLFNFAKSVGLKLSVLDIGGDFPINNDKEPTFQQVADIVNSQIEAFFPSSEFTDLRIIGEPGSFYAKSAFTACTSIIAKKEVGSTKEDNIEDLCEADDNGVGYMYYINDGVYGCFNTLFTQDQFVPTPLKDLATGCQEFPSNIWGPTCDGLDKVCEMNLPEMETGDWLVWKDMGAYTMGAGTKFNGFKTKCVHYYISEKNWHELENSVIVDEEQNTIGFNKKKLGVVFGKDLKQLKSCQNKLFSCEKTNVGKENCSL